MSSTARKLPADQPSESIAVSSRPRTAPWALYAAAATAAFSSIAYELLLASYATFLLGATVFQYSLVISLMMASMGLGALLTERLKKNAAHLLVGAELMLALAATAAIPILYVCYAIDLAPQMALLFFVVLMGGALGMEIPLLNRLQPGHRGLSRILFFDYVGGFVGGLAFPLWLLPNLGFFRIAALLGTLNAVLAVALTFSLRDRLGRREFIVWVVAATLSLIGAVIALYHAETLRRLLEIRLFQIAL